MTILIKHAFVSAKGDGGDATLVRPSNWNAAHSTSMASGQIIGRLSAGVGAFEEIPISAYMAGLLASADAAALAGALGLFETGDVKYTFKNSAAAGWLLLTGGTALSIGSATSGATLRANADTQALYTLLWNNVADGQAPVSGGRGANAAADFAANKTLTIPNLVGRSPMGAGAATAGLSARALGITVGEETHVLTQTEMPAHYHGAGIYDPGHGHTSNISGVGSSTTGGGGFTVSAYGTAVINNSFTGIRVQSANGLDTTDTRGGGGAHNVIHPVTALNVMVKL